MSNPETSPMPARAAVHPSALRTRIPPSGLREYWYPLIVAAKVPRQRPVQVPLLDTEVTVFRGSDGEIGALDPICPHRGASLSQGDCHFEGTVSCPYHGWTFDRHGELLAVLGEGPRSPLPGMSSARAKAYPTRTLKGMTFIWMGDGDPAPIEEDVPEEFFDEGALVQFAQDMWDCNWRVAMENIFDAHVFYVHRNSVQFRLLPVSTLLAMVHLGPRRARPSVINNRAIAYRMEDNPTARLLSEDVGDRADSDPSLPGDGTEDMAAYRSAYPGLDGQLWPRSNLRFRWSQLMARLLDACHRVGLRRARGRQVHNEEWNGLHLPATFRVDYQTHVYTRFGIPVGTDRTRVVYLHTTYPPSTRRRVLDCIHFRLWQNWQMNFNFSGQDKKIVENQSFSHREKLSATDAFPLAWRSLIVEHSRDSIREREGASRFRESPVSLVADDEQ